MKTKYICPDCRRDRNKTVNLVTTKNNPRPECPDCGFKCRRFGNTVIPANQDRRGFGNSINWEAIEIPFDYVKYMKKGI